VESTATIVTTGNILEMEKYNICKLDKRLHPGIATIEYYMSIAQILRKYRFHILTLYIIIGSTYLL